MHVLLLEPDRVVARCISDEFARRNIKTTVVSSADRAIAAADSINPDVVISELSLPGHSGSEFLYEFRTYTDWDAVPLIIYSSTKPTAVITGSKDWALLRIAEFLYKPDSSLQKLGDIVESLASK